MKGRPARRRGASSSTVLAVTDQPPDDDLPILGTQEEQAAGKEAVLAALRLMPTQTFEQLAANSSLESEWVRPTVMHLEGEGLVRISLRDGMEYVTLKG